VVATLIMKSLTTFFFTNKRLVVVFLVFASASVLTRLVPNTSVAQSINRSVNIDIPKHLPIKVKLKADKEKAIKEMKNEKWLRDFELEVENTGTKPIYFLDLLVILPDTRNETGLQIAFPLVYGRTEISNIKTKADSTDVPIKPGETYVFKIFPTQIPAWESRVREGRAQPEKVNIVFQILSFGDGTGFAGSDGEALPHPPNEL
jgi:hypothetical protein